MHICLPRGTGRCGGRTWLVGHYSWDNSGAMHIGVLGTCLLNEAVALERVSASQTFSTSEGGTGWAMSLHLQGSLVLSAAVVSGHPSKFLPVVTGQFSAPVAWLIKEREGACSYFCSWQGERKAMPRD